MIIVVTWNISGLDHSVYSVKKDQLGDKWNLIGDQLEILQPDILTLQELPNYNLTIKYAKRLNLLLVGSIQSHMGYTSLFIKKEWGNSIIKIYRKDPVIACILEKNGERWGIGGFHLPPKTEFADYRKKILVMIMSFFESQNVSKIIIAGDANMRKAENNIPYELGLRDCFIEKGSPFAKRWTWDSYLNQYHGHGFKFRCRFDRVFMKGWNCKQFDLIGNESINKRCYLSDHFGIKVLLS